MPRFALAAVALVAPLWLAGPALAQESKAAQSTRKVLQQKVTIEAKDIGTKAFLEDLNRELEKEFKFVIDNASGVSNNTKISIKVKDATVEKVLNEMSDKLDCGWYVVSNAANNKLDGKVVLRKSSKGKERGYEAGKEPKKSSLKPTPQFELTERPALTARASAPRVFALPADRQGAEPIAK